VSARVPRHANADFSAFARRLVNSAAFMGERHSARVAAVLPVLVQRGRLGEARLRCCVCLEATAQPLVFGLIAALPYRNAGRL
jgi:hypothetical protein